MLARVKSILSQLCHKHSGSSCEIELAMEASRLHWKASGEHIASQVNASVATNLLRQPGISMYVLTENENHNAERSIKTIMQSTGTLLAPPTRLPHLMLALHHTHDAKHRNVISPTPPTPPTPPHVASHPSRRPHKRE